MQTFLTWLKENAQPTALKGWGEFEDDGATHLAARDKVEDSGNFRDVAIYFYRVNDFINKKINDLNKLSTNHGTGHETNLNPDNFPFNPHIKVELPGEFTISLGVEQEPTNGVFDSAINFQPPGGDYPYDLIVDVLVYRGRTLKKEADQLMTNSKKYTEAQKIKNINDYLKTIKHIVKVCHLVISDSKRPNTQTNLGRQIVKYIAQCRLDSLVKDALNQDLK